MSITLQYTLKSGQTDRAVIAIGEDEIVIPFAVYKDGELTFNITETGAYDVIYNKKAFTLPSTVGNADFTDEEKINAWAIDEVKAIQAAGIVGGKSGNLYDPQGIAKRAEVATIFTRFIEIMAL